MSVLYSSDSGKYRVFVTGFSRKYSEIRQDMQESFRRSEKSIAFLGQDATFYMASDEKVCYTPPWLTHLPSPDLTDEFLIAFAWKGTATLERAHKNHRGHIQPSETLCG